MQVMVKGSDGQFYGPVDEAALRQWRTEGRVTDASETKDFQTGMAGTVAQVLGPAAPPPPQPAQPMQPGQPLQPTGFGNQYADYRRPAYQTQTPTSSKSEGWMIAAILGRCALALVLFFVLHGIGLIIAGYTVFYAFQLNAQGSKYGVFALVASILTFVVIGAGWLFRVGGGAP